MGNSVDPDLKKPADQGLHCFQNSLKKTNPGSAEQGLNH